MWKFDNEVPEQQLENFLLQATQADWKVVGINKIKEYQWIEEGNRNRGNDSILQLARQTIHSLREKTNPLMEQIVVKEMELVNQLPISSWPLDKVERYIRILQYAPKHPAVPLLKKATERLSEADRQTRSGKRDYEKVSLKY